jgi:hypothetical protein
MYRRRACTQVLFLQTAELGFFSLFRNSDRLAGAFRWSEDPSRVSRWYYLPLQKILLAENRFLLKARKGAENTKEKSRQCFTIS